MSANSDHAAPQPFDPAPPLPRATGPRTRAGKARSRANAVKHGLRCQIVKPPDQRDQINERVIEWTEALRPTDALQRWLVSRAATASVRLDRCVERENIALEENTAAAERVFFRRRRAWARRTGYKLQENPKKAFARLTSSAFGCDWLIDRWDELAADLEIPGGYWSRADFLHALLMLGYDYDRIPPGEPTVAKLYLASLAADRAPNPEEVDAFLSLKTADLDPAARAASQRKHLGDRDSGRRVLLGFVRAEQERLRTLRASLWETTDAPALEAVCAQARTFDACPDAALARRYESALALELHRNLNGFYRARSESENRQGDADSGNVPAPNERQDGQFGAATQENKSTSEVIPPASPASPPRLQEVVAASPVRPHDVSDRQKRPSLQAARKARKQARRKGR